MDSSARLVLLCDPAYRIAGPWSRRTHAARFEQTAEGAHHVDRQARCRHDRALHRVDRSVADAGDSHHAGLTGPQRSRR